MEERITDEVVNDLVAKCGELVTLKPNSPWNKESELNGVVWVLTTQMAEELLCARRLCVSSSPPHVWTGYNSLSFDIHISELMNVDNKPTQPPNQTMRLHHGLKDTTKLDDMIQLVDRTRFKKLLATGAEGWDDVNEDVVDNLLRRWALAKYSFYILFGEKLSHTFQLEYEMDQEEAGLRKKTMMKKHPNAAGLLYFVGYDELIDNRVSYNSFMDEYIPQYVSGKKVTKLLWEVFNDQAILDTYADLFSTRTVKKDFHFSINPYDYMTMSTNKHGWSSCFKLKSGEYQTGTLASLLDEVTILTVAHDDEDHSYELYGLKWKGNSKSWRQSVYVDPMTSSMLFSRQYPKEMPNHQDIRVELETLISNHLGIENRWKVSKGNTDDSPHGYIQNSRAMYHDIGEYDAATYFKVVHPSIDPLAPTWYVGEDPMCVKCGEVISDARSNFVCNYC